MIIIFLSLKQLNVYFNFLSGKLLHRMLTSDALKQLWYSELRNVHNRNFDLHLLKYHSLKAMYIVKRSTDNIK